MPRNFRWDGLKSFLSLPRQPLYCGNSKGTKAFVRSYKNLHFYWILGAGHFVSPNPPQIVAARLLGCEPTLLLTCFLFAFQVPADQPCIALSMIGSITQSPAT
jgi:serine carboxypeptidase 1